MTAIVIPVANLSAKLINPYTNAHDSCKQKRCDTFTWTDTHPYYYMESECAWEVGARGGVLLVGHPQSETIVINLIMAKSPDLSFTPPCRQKINSSYYSWTCSSAVSMWKRIKVRRLGHDQQWTQANSTGKHTSKHIFFRRRACSNVQWCLLSPYNKSDG